MTITNARIDLNLVRVFVTIYETRSVTAAAERLFLTQPSVSYALSKLRDALQDPLFIRGPEGMTPTIRGELAYKKFSAAMVNIDSVVNIGQPFEPATSSQRFRVAMSDIGELTFLPPLLKQMRREAPDVELEVVQVAVNEMAGWLAAGKVDAVIGNLPGLQSAVKSVKLFSERYACLLQKDSPTIGNSLDLDGFISARHILVSSPFSGHRLVEDILQQRGIKRKIALQVSHFTIVPRLIADHDLLVTVPSRVGQYFEMDGRLRTLDIPIDIPHFEVRLFWHEHQEEKTSHRWLRNLITDTLRTL